MNKLNLGVIFGSRSCEHEVSVISAVQLMKQADKEKYHIVPVYIAQDGAWFTGEALKDLATYVPRFNPGAAGLVRVQPDVTARSGALITWRSRGLYRGSEVAVAARLDVVIPVLHGLHGEDGTLQGLLELMDIPYASSGVGASAATMDKIVMKQYLRSFNFPVLKDMALTRSAWRKDAVEVIKTVEQTMPYPVFVKPATLGSSIGVSRADSFQTLSDALELAFTYDRRVLVEEGLTKPIEVNCAVLGYDDEVSASVVEMPLSGGDMLDFMTKYLQSGGTKGMASLSRCVPAPIGEELTQKVQALSLEVFKALDLRGVVRIDYMIHPQTERLTITEVNAIPGSMAFYLWNQSDPKLPYPELIDRLVDIAIRAHEDKLENNLAFKSDILKNSAMTGGKFQKGGKL